ncbi:6,7-dimethyl-8-ribityllumazine synthase [Pseudorhodoplanes sp.]|jgi:6,7-dimethyl-8-ribityllumazine synthase|uniref:6,7-dimethyl-8-ribityllumazine synthase n=1 Tax=Pseudorhodoplanes sp. TaxID=1934341 RepID=UPI002C43C475|nr:6,7-dimethyl-8-ribityllumazine synthase [Pseudorhodoplanes sp.]HWV41463.1 6,7-dimethyl-8-ribityllumazine synthase [Pseudorhodoplanes sp.]
MAGPRQSKDQTGAGSLKGARILVVEARYYEEIADALLSGVISALDDQGATYDRITVPGALEIPTALAIALDAAAARKKPYDGAVALGCVIRGETLHFEIVSEQSARGVMDVSLARNIPIGNGILTVDTEAQAFARARVTEGDKGGEAARAALTLIRIKRAVSAKTRR